MAAYVYAKTTYTLIMGHQIIEILTWLKSEILGPTTALRREGKLYRKKAYKKSPTRGPS